MGAGSKAPEQQQYEPVKPAEAVASEQSADASRAQAMRRGIASAFSRSGMMGNASAGATAGTATKLGA